jgi:hypothetical protein
MADTSSFIGEIDSPQNIGQLIEEHNPPDELIETLSCEASPQSGRRVPVENSMARRATVAPDSPSPWHGATEAPHATVAHHATVEHPAMVKGELRVPNTINFRLFPTLDPFAKAVYYELFLLSHGFSRDTCVIGLAKLAQLVLMSQRKVQNTITYLERRGLVRRLQPVLGGPAKGIVYQVLIPAGDLAPHATAAGSTALAPGASLAQDATVAPDTSVAQRATNKDDDDDDDDELKNNHHQRDRKRLVIVKDNENHRGAAPPRERNPPDGSAFDLVRDAYEKATGNRWSRSDTEAYEKHRLGGVRAADIISTLEAVVMRTPTKINSFKYFVREIVAIPDGRQRAWQKKQLKNIVSRIRDNSVGRADYTAIDFREDVKCACAREGVVFNDDLYNELVG